MIGVERGTSERASDASMEPPRAGNNQPNKARQLTQTLIHHTSHAQSNRPLSVDPVPGSLLRLT